MSMPSVFLAHKGLVLAAIAAGALLVIYVLPLDSMSEALAAKGGDPGPKFPTPGEGNKYGWVKKGGPPPKPR